MTSPPAPRLDCVRELINAARANKFSTLRKLSATDQDVFDVWDNVSQLVEFHMVRKKAVHIPGLGTFTFTSSKLDVGHNKYILIQRPVFILSEKLARTHRLTQSKYHVPGEIPVIQLNLTALSYEMNLDRDLVEASVKEVVNALSHNIEQTRSGEFAFTTIGNLVISNGAAKMRFLPIFVEQMDQTGGLARFLSKRPETSSSVLSDQSLVLPKIQPGDGINKEKTSKSPDIESIKEDVEESLDASAEGTSIEKLSATSPKTSPASSPNSKKKEALVPTLKVESKSPVIQQLSLPTPQITNAYSPGTPRKVPNFKKTIHFKDPRTECESRESRVFPLAVKLSKSNLINELLKDKDVSSPKMQSRAILEDKSCANCADNMSDFCYLCYQREKRNVPIYFTEERKKDENEEDRLLQTYTLLKDSEDLQREQDMKAKKREESQSIAAFNLSVSESLKDKKEERPLNFNRSYVFHRRPITPPHYIKQEDYKADLARQVNVKSKRLAKSKNDREILERVEQLQLAEDLAAQRDHYLKSKRLQSDEYRKALDTQVYIKKCLEERNLESSDEDRTFALPRPNILIPFQKNIRLKTGANTMMVYRSSELPEAYPDSDGPIFGIHDTNDESKTERRKRAQLLYQNQIQAAHSKKEQLRKRDAATKKEEEAMLRKTKNELLNETLIRNSLNLQQRQNLEKTWAAHDMKKKAKEFEEKLLARSPGLLLQEQCDKYKRCAQCTRKPMNMGKSNVWAESRYVSGSRLII